MKLRWGIFAGAAIAAALLIAFVVPKLGSSGAVASGPLTLPDGSVVRVVGFTYGTNHTWGSPMEMAVQRLPAPLRTIIRRVVGINSLPVHSMTTSDPSLVVWVDRAATNLPPGQITSSYSASLSNGGGAIAGSEADIGLGIRGLAFAGFPRREAMLSLEIFNGHSGVGAARVGSLKFPNPYAGTHPQWKPQPIPATNFAGDVQVVLEGFFTGVDRRQLGTSGSRDRVRVKLKAATDSAGAFAALRLFSTNNPKEVWSPTSVTLSDATGNRVKNRGMSKSNPGSANNRRPVFVITFHPVLWPDEAAWNFDLEIKRTEGFASGELLTFRNVPLGALNQTNLIGWQTNLGGVSVTLEHIVRRPPFTNSSYSTSDFSGARFTFAGATNGIHVDLVSARLDDGTDLEADSWWSHDGVSRTYSFRNITTNAVTADFTIAVHRSRRVQFLVKPELGPVDIELPTGP